MKKKEKEGSNWKLKIYIEKYIRKWFYFHLTKKMSTIIGKNVKEQTEYKLEVLLYIYNKYCKNQNIEEKDFYRIYKYIYKFPTRRQMNEDLNCSS